MRRIARWAWLISAAAWGEPLTVTSGWATVVDVEGVSGVESSAPAVVTARALDERQVLLVGGAPGRATVRVAGAEPRTMEVVVKREPAFEPDDALLPLEVGRPFVSRPVDARRVVVGDASTCDAKVASDGRLELAPKRPGFTTLVLWTGGESAAERRVLMLGVAAGVRRSGDDVTAVLTEPLGRLALIAGERLLLDAPGVRWTAVVDEAVAEVRPSAQGALELQGKAMGATWLVLWAEGGRPQRRYVVVHPHVAGEVEASGEAPGELTPPRPRAIPLRRVEERR